jgi:5'-nucleotidase (lipoprotein e(P4) family)
MASPQPADERLLAVLWFQSAAESRANALQTYRGARMALDRALADRNWTAAVEQSGAYQQLPPAVILDIDETVLDNSIYDSRNILTGGVFNESTWFAWTQERAATPIAGALEFLRYAASRGVEIFYVTSRTMAEEEATRDNLAKYGFPLNPAIDTVLTKGEGSAEPTSDKQARRALIARDYRILLLIGDDFNDFISGVNTTVAERRALVDQYESYWGERWFVIANPVYGSWERVLTRADHPLTPVERMQRKLEALELGRE